MQLLWVTLLSIRIAFVIAGFLAKRFSVPVDQLSIQAKMLAADNYEPLFEKESRTELDGLADSMDKTAEKLSEAKKYQRELLANVSHDLRTPLTMIKGYAEMIRDVSWEDETARNADIGIIIREADRLTALVNEILEYSRLQETGAGRKFTLVNFSETVRKLIYQFEPLMEKKKILIEHHIDDDCIVNGDATLLENMAYNLIDNSLRHTNGNSRIIITGRKLHDAPDKLPAGACGFFYNHHDELTLLLKRAEGTRYENFLGQMQQLSQKHTVRRIRTSPVQLMIHPMTLKALMDAYYTAVFGILMADLPRNDTLQAMVDLQRFYQGGLEAIVKTEK